MLGRWSHRPGSLDRRLVALQYGNRTAAQMVALELMHRGIDAEVLASVSPRRGFYVRIGDVAQRENGRDALIQQLAREFSKNVRANERCRQNMDEIIRRNEIYDDDVCATHDFCDANMLMAAAVETVLGHECNPESEQEAELWSAAWASAKRARFVSGQCL